MTCRTTGAGQWVEPRRRFRNRRLELSSFRHCEGAFSYAWIKTHILNISAFRNIRAPKLTGAPDLVLPPASAFFALGLFAWAKARKTAE